MQKELLVEIVHLQGNGLLQAVEAWLIQKALNFFNKITEQEFEEKLEKRQ